MNDTVRVLVLAFLVGCLFFNHSDPGLCADPKGDLIILHAGSLKVPLADMKKAFQAKYPQVSTQMSGGGSSKMARLIADAGKTADIMASADYTVIDKLLVPGKASWNVRFASNQMVICYTDKSKFAKDINNENWYDVLCRKGVKWGHTDPDLDPAGYRSLMVLQLAEMYYKKPGLNQRLVDNRPHEYVMPDAEQMVRKLKDGELDYAWEYLSVAAQHKLKYVKLPDNINLGNYAFDDFYKQAKVEVAAKKSGKKSVKRGKSITYGVTLINDAPNRDAALAFLQYLLSPEGGLKILKDQGQPPFIPCRVSSEEMKDQLPDSLKGLVVVKP